MTTDNLTVVKGIYDAFARRDMEAIGAVIDPAATIVQDSPLPWSGTYTGAAGLGEFLGTLLAHLEPTVYTEELVNSGDYVVQIGRTRGRVLSNDKEFDTRELHVWRLRDGLVTSFQVFIDVPDMLAALAA